MTLTDWVAVVLGAIIIVGILAIAILKRGRHKRISALQRQADWREHALRHLSPADREHFGREWRLVEAHYMEDPRSAVAEADRVVEELLSARGCPVSEWQAGAPPAIAKDQPDPANAAAAAPKPQVVESYCEAHEIAVKQARGDARGKELRRAMLDYRVVFDDLVGDLQHGTHSARHEDSGDREHDPVPARRNG